MNRLASEKSPYLLQHADNPVDWYPWGDAAFEVARREDKPIFLSVGYSTCHWCHVMAHESFEDAHVAAVLNEHFISIKVDREERPDVDRMYMTFVQATTGGGGWPMSVWLMPDRRPFHGGTYFPPTSRWGKPGFADLLMDVVRLWRDERARVELAAAGVTDHLASAGAGAAAGGTQVPGTIALDGATRDFLASYDRRHGGFGGAPKFPRPSELLFLLREHRRTGEGAPLDVVAHTLRAMAAGGMRDHVGGGFHRYSVDGQWRVPHFEKMLYDQAQLVLAFVEAAQATGDRFFIEVAEDTLRYVQRDMTDEHGGFYSAEDADSLPPGEAPGGHKSEGAFYLWTAREIGERLGPDAQAFSERYGVQPDGNALNDPHAEFTGRNILYEARPIEEIAGETERSADDVRAAVSRSRDILFRVRKTRPRPQLDDKVLTAWNGLMIAAFARAARVVTAMRPVTTNDAETAERAEDTEKGSLAQAMAQGGSPGGHDTVGQGADPDQVSAVGQGSDPARVLAVGHGFPGLSGVEGIPAQSYLTAARRAASFIRDRMWDPATLRLLRRFRDGEAAIDAYAEDYACLIFGVLELFQADGDPAWLEWAVALQARQDALFWDDEAGGWFSTTGQDETVLLRLKEDYDGAEPAASSVAVVNLLALSHLDALRSDLVKPASDAGAAASSSGRSGGDAASKIERTLMLFASRLTGAPRAVPMMLAALSAWHAGLSEVVIVGPRADGATSELLREVNRTYQPFVVLVAVDAKADASRRLLDLLPWVGGQTMREGKPTAYVCRNFVCERPTTDPKALGEQLRGVRG